MSNAWEFKLFGKWCNFGWSFRSIGFGFRVDKYQLTIDLGFIWLGMEF